MRLPLCIAPSCSMLMTRDAMQALQKEQEESAQLKAAQAISVSQ